MEHEIISITEISIQTVVRLLRSNSQMCIRDRVRTLGFGAGMGLPNMKKYTDEMEIQSEVGKGTKVFMRVYL